MTYYGANTFKLYEEIVWTANIHEIAEVESKHFYDNISYDIDKAYIMGQEFGDDGKLIKYSNLFDYSSLETLQASSWLPTPKNLFITWNQGQSGFNINKHLERLAPYIGITENLPRATYIREMADLIIDMYDYLEKTGLNSVNIICEEEYEDIAQLVIRDIITHESTKVSPNLEESAYKNSISFNIKNIVQDLKNMDLAYSPIAMGDLQKLAAESEKGALVASMSLMNPLTKYLMQVQNMVGKKVIGIAAVGEKVFFNLSYYFNEGLRSGDEKWIQNLLFTKTFNRILGRYNYNKKKGDILTITKTQLANVNFSNNENLRVAFLTSSQISDYVKSQYSITDEDIVNENANGLLYKTKIDLFAEELKTGLISAEWRSLHENITRSGPVDLLISLILSAATDNAKELILSKINCSANLARCHLYLTMLGFDIKDTVSFMTSPCVSLINDLSEANMMDSYIPNLRIEDSMDIVDGIIDPSKFLFGIEYSKDEDGYTTKTSRIEATFSRLKTDKLKNVLTAWKKALNPKFIGFKNLQEYLQAYIKVRLEGAELEPLEAYVKTSKYESKKELQRLSDYVEKVIYSIDKTINKYALRYTTIDIDSIVDPNDPDFKIGDATYQAYLDDLAQARTKAIEEFNSDLEEFRNVYKLATETTTLGGVFLGMNQGLPGSKEDLQGKLRGIGDAIKTREDEFGIRADTFEIDIAQDTKDPKKALKNKLKTITKKFLKLEENNQFISNNREVGEDGIIDPDTDQMYTALEQATAFGIVGNFKVEKWLYDVQLTALDIVAKNFYGREIDVDRILLGRESISYREVVANYYNVIKGTWNIFDMMNRIPQYKAIIDLLKTEYVFDKHSSVRSNLTNIIFDKVYAKTKFIDERLNKIILNYVNDLLITSFFRSKEFNFPAYEGKESLDSNYKNKVINKEVEMIDLNNAPGRAAFKKVFESIISGLKATGRYGDAIIEGYETNAFIQGLRIVNDQYEVPSISLELDMMKLNSTPNSLRMFQEYLNGFSLLRKVNINGIPLSDWFILYNLYVNLNSYGSDKLTTLFKNAVANKGSVLETYFQYIGNLDFLKVTGETLKELEFNMDDLLIRMALTIQKSQEEDYASKGVKYIRSKNNNGEYVIKELHRVGRGKNAVGVYKEISTFPNKDLLDTESSGVSEEQKSNYQLYLMIPMKNQDFNVSLREGIMSSDIDVLVKTLVTYSRKGLLQIFKENC